MAAISESDKKVCKRTIHRLLLEAIITPEWEMEFERICHIVSDEWTEYDWSDYLCSLPLHLPVLRYFVERGYVHPNNDSNVFLLGDLVAEDCREHVVYLLSEEVGGNINIQSSTGSTPLHEYLYYRIGDDAIDGDSDDISEDEWSDALEGVEFLLENGADPLLADMDGNSPLDHAEIIGGISKEQRESLLALMRRYV